MMYNAKRVRLLWVLEHSDIEGNEIVDRFGKSGCYDGFHCSGTSVKTVRNTAYQRSV